MENRLSSLRETLEDSLDDLSSPRTSNDVKTHALKSLEKLLASVVVPNSSTEDLDYFLALQYTFECNVPSRILSWVASATFRLDLLIKQGTITPEAEPEVATLTSQLTLALSIIQGVCLTHAPTKIFLGRRYALEVLLDLFISSRHLSSTPFAGTTTNTNNNNSPAKPVPGAPLPLASVILDTLLCVLVDSSPALRVFESCHGVHAVVKILKRAGTPREVRMKCLEFLYFYLLDETTSSLPVETPTPMPTPAPTAPSTPMQAQLSKKPFPNATPSRPMSRYGSSTFSLTSSSFVSSAFTSTSIPYSSSSSSSSSGSGSESGMKSRSTSGSSTSSFSSTSSNAGSTPRSRSPKKPSVGMGKQTPTATPTGKHTQTPTTPAPKLRLQPQPRALMMLRKDLDFVPLSPKRAVVAGEDGAPLGKPRGVGVGVVRTRSRLVSDEDSAGEEAKMEMELMETKIDSETETETEVEEETGERGREARETRTTEEKKKLLGTMLGNVEALVEGVRKAGIWGLG
ncbi:Carbamoyl-phosphate synthase [Mycena sanguinolenta]|uniref:Carbamoyl-phosphate synthase n=1 Tax=Mycena sanguinolenta TaxID=230812 RepID=A0A8H6X655_9AGAR|nr:Carbamoyl-phosphate synthase [Mycena sanguinolenta]